MKPKRRLPEPDGPAVIIGEHAQDREISPVAGSPKAWRRYSVLELAHKRGQLNGGAGKEREYLRLKAAEDYVKLFLTAQSSGKDSTDVGRVISVSQRMPITERQVIAMRDLARIERNMGSRDRLIIRKVCGENYRLSEAVMAACGAGYRDRVTARFREALDALIEAMETARREPISREAARDTSL